MATVFEARDGSRFRIRPIRPADEPAMVDFHAALSPETVYSRYFETFGLTARTAHDRLLRICHPDFARDIPLVAEETTNGKRRIAAVGRLSISDDRQDGEFALLVGDPWQGKGLGSELLKRLVSVARAEGLSLIWAEILGANTVMRRTALAAGFTLTDDRASFTTRAELRLT